MQVILTKWIFHATINQFRKVTNSFRGAAAASSASTAVSPGNPTWPAGRQAAATGFGPQEGGKAAGGTARGRKCRRGGSWDL